MATFGVGFAAVLAYLPIVRSSEATPRRPRRRLAARSGGGRWAGLALALQLLWPSRAHAQQLDLGLFMSPSGDAATFTIPTPAPAPHGTVQVGVFTDYAHRLLDQSVACGASAQDPACGGLNENAYARVPNLAQGALLLDVALFDAFALGLTLPVSIAEVQTNQTGSADSSVHAGLSDIVLGLKGGFVTHGPTQVGFRIQLSFPSSEGSTWTGDRAATLTPGLLFTQAFGRLTLAAQAGYHMRKRVVVLGIEQDDEFVLGVGARYALSRSFAVLSELNARLGVGGRSFSAAEAPAEIDVGVRFGTLPGVQFDVGIGTAAWPGQGGAGAPLVRGFLVLRTAFETSGCQFGPEDFDGFEDADGCNDPDNDRDGVLDADDACINDAEDYDGYEDADGCPDPDNDADGIPDAVDLCPERSEDRDGFQDQDGCPEPDNDADGVPDGSDRCPLDPEDHDDFEDADGCPEPGPGRPTVTLSGSRLLMSDRIYFEDEADTIRPVSTLALDTLAATLKSLPGRPRVRVEGHTDDSGNPQYNIDLSYRRARAVVEYLRAQGVDPAQLEYVGRGSSSPIAPNNSPEGRALNRRVEFVVVDR
jgi:outer membrane protein OmpA-like peptidoglycan-associated protein